jgi:hypothetical protein
MAFTVNVDTLIGKVRLLIGDDKEGAGPLPDGSNFTDEQVLFFLEEEDQSYGAAAAMACENLSTRYAALVDTTVGPRRESLSQATKQFADRASVLRDSFGGGGAGVISAGLVKVDGYSEDIPADAVTDPTAAEAGLSEFTEDHFRYILP